MIRLAGRTQPAMLQVTWVHYVGWVLCAAHPSRTALGTRELSDTESWLWGSRHFLFSLIPICSHWCLTSPCMFVMGRKPSANCARLCAHTLSLFARFAQSSTIAKLLRWESWSFKAFPRWRRLTITAYLLPMRETTANPLPEQFRGCKEREMEPAGQKRSRYEQASMRDLVEGEPLMLGLMFPQSPGVSLSPDLLMHSFALRPLRQGSGQASLALRASVLKGEQVFPQLEMRCRDEFHRTCLGFWRRHQH